MNFCTKCGNPLKPNARFCGKCGEKVIQVIKPEQPEPVAAPVCSSCGSVLIPGVKFCTACGAPVAGSISVPHVSVLPPFVKPGKPPKPIKQGKQRKEGGKPQKKRNVGLLKIAASVIIIAGLCAAAWFLMFNKNPGADTALPEYTAYPVVSGSTTTESKKITAKAGSDAMDMLSDSSSVFIPGLKGNTSIELKKETNSIRLNLPGVQTSGYMLSLSIQGSDSIHTLMPRITIPRSQVGDINPLTINIVRISDVICGDGSIIKNQPRSLPVTLDKAGNYTALDYLFPYTALSKKTTTARAGDIITRLAQALIPAACAEGNYLAGFADVGNVTYSIITFQGDVNWKKTPKLVQMIPDRRTGHFRHPSTKPERFERTAPVVNVVVLVHGHNEEEKGGYVESVTKDLWEFDYKRDVWNYMYKYYLDETSVIAGKDPNRKDSCTLFYEFIYPTYRPIFSPVPNGKNIILPHRTLGEDLGEAINKELTESNPQIAEMIKNKTPFNLFIVAHSMGGLVARAGIRYFNRDVNSNFRQLITWGTPHQGSPLTTLRYIAEEGFNVKYDGMILQPFGDIVKNKMERLVMHTPGTFDLRWTNGSKGVEKFFKYNTLFGPNAKQEDKNELSLGSGSKFFNDNLRIFNEKEAFSEKYTFLTGSTTKTAHPELGWFDITKAWYFDNATDIEKGAFLINLLAGDDSYKANDGASPVYSQAGKGLLRWPKSIDMGNVDHQQFYEDFGVAVAAKTFEVMKGSATCDCPYIGEYKLDKDKISAKLIWPNDPNPGKKIKRIEAVVTDKKTKEVITTSTGFNFNDPTGIFSGAIPPGEKDKDKDLQLMLNVTTKDGSNLEYSAGLNSDNSAVGSQWVCIEINCECGYLGDKSNARAWPLYFFMQAEMYQECSKSGLKWSNDSFHYNLSDCQSNIERGTINFTVNGQLTADNKCNIQLLQTIDRNDYAWREITNYSLINVPYKDMEVRNNETIYNYLIYGPQIKDLILKLENKTIFKDHTSEQIVKSYNDKSYISIRFLKPNK
ncbi:MAG: zinc-ribbon domain-containing protein [Bacteroidetes bacterium]|nr:zinc-ribbon domain-containing protein [Bacteroidota bacterium]